MMQLYEGHSNILYCLGNFLATISKRFHSVVQDHLLLVGRQSAVVKYMV